MDMKPKGDMKGGEYGDEPAGDDTGDGDMEKFKSLAQEAFPDDDMTDERVAALKEFVKACYEKEAV